MHLSCVLAFLAASAVTLGAPIDNKNARPKPSTIMDINGLKQMQSEEWGPATTHMDMEAHNKRFYYHHYDPLERRNVESESRVEVEAGVNAPEKRFYYDHYFPLERRDMNMSMNSIDRRFYYDHYEPLERRDMDSIEKRFYYNNYEPLTARDAEPIDKRFYYNNYEPLAQ